MNDQLRQLNNWSKKALEEKKLGVFQKAKVHFNIEKQVKDLIHQEVF